MQKTAASMEPYNNFPKITIQPHIKFTPYKEETQNTWLTYLVALKILKKNMFT